MNIVLTDWRGIFTAQHPKLHDISHPEGSYHSNLAVMALHHAPHYELQEIPELPSPAWKQLSLLKPRHHTRYTAALLEHPTQARHMVLVTGDAREVLHHSSIAVTPRGETVELSSHLRNQLESAIHDREAEGYFPIGIAMKHTHDSTISRDTIHQLVFVGIANASFDFIPESHHVIHALTDKNIHIKIISPMALRLSQAIARRVGIASSEDLCITGNILATMSDAELRECVSHVNIFSELEFADEQRIARILEDSGHRIVRHEFAPR